MANKSKFQAIRGTRDLLPSETALWNHVEQTAQAAFGTFGFGEIRLPIFEPTELLARAVGSDTDIVSKEMFTFMDPPDTLEQNQRTMEGILTIVQPVRVSNSTNYSVNETHLAALAEMAKRWKESDRVSL